MKLSKQQLEDPGLPKWTRPVSIAAYSIETLPISIAAQTLGVVQIDIATQSGADVDVNLTNAVVTIAGSVAIIGTVTISGTVAISGTVTVAGTVSISGTVTVTGSVVVSGSVYILDTVTVTGSVTVSGTVSISGTVTISGTVSITGTVTVSGSVTVSGTVSISGTVTVSGSVTVSGTVSISGTVTIQGTAGGTAVQIQGVEGGTAVSISGNVTVSGTVSISGTVTVSGSVTVSGTVSISGTVTVSGTVSISGTVTVSGSVTVSGTVSISGTVTISGTVSITGTVTISGSVTITSGAVTISTTGGTNIVIDKLTQTAYLERRSTLSNNGASASWTHIPSTGRVCKFFPRGARGFIATVDAYCRDKGAAGGTLTVYLHPAMDMASIDSATITIPASGSADWRSATFNRMWNYDSLLITVVGSTDDMEIGRDTGTPYDGYWYTIATAVYTDENNRNWLRAIYSGETIGDIPVSGTLNVVKLPSASASSEETDVSCSNGTITSVVTLNGAGTCVWLRLHYQRTLHTSMDMRIFVDGVNVRTILASTLGQAEFDEPPIEIENITDHTVFTVFLPFEFLRSVEIKGRQASGVAVNADGLIVANKLS